MNLSAGEAETVQRYIKGLRSGTFTQCFGEYGRGHMRCAVGVSEALGLEDDVRRNPALKETYEYRGNRRGLIGLNDIERVSFADIADIVEAKFFPKEQT